MVLPLVVYAKTEQECRQPVHRFSWVTFHACLMEAIALGIFRFAQSLV
jgi:hypothetical protein